METKVRRPRRSRYNARLNLAVIVEEGPGIVAIYPVLDTGSGETLGDFTHRPRKRLDLLDRIEDEHDRIVSKRSIVAA